MAEAEQRDDGTRYGCFAHPDFRASSLAVLEQHDREQHRKPTAFLITHPQGQQREDILVEGDDVTLHFDGGWAVFTDAHGPCLAIPAARDATIQRVDEPGDQAAT